MTASRALEAGGPGARPRVPPAPARPARRRRLGMYIAGGVLLAAGAPSQAGIGTGGGGSSDVVASSRDALPPVEVEVEVETGVVSSSPAAGYAVTDAPRVLALSVNEPVSLPARPVTLLDGGGRPIEGRVEVPG